MPSALRGSRETSMYPKIQGVSCSDRPCDTRARDSIWPLPGEPSYSVVLRQTVCRASKVASLAALALLLHLLRLRYAQARPGDADELRVTRQVRRNCESRY